MAIFKRNFKQAFSLFAICLTLFLSACANDYSVESTSIEISEIMSKNRTVYCAQDGEYKDWVEIHNKSNELIKLENWTISDGKNSCSIPDIILGVDEYYVITLNAFSIKEGETIKLIKSNGDEAISVVVSKMDADSSMVICSDGTYKVSKYATPGFENSKQGYLKYESSKECPSSIIINEVMVSNSEYACLLGNLFCDWIELKNNSSEDISLSNYYLSDKYDNLHLWQLPETTLKAGELVLVYCCSDTSTIEELTGTVNNQDYIIAPFSLSCSGENLWLSNNVDCVDSIYLRDIPVNGSYGRMDGEQGFFFFETPSPMAANKGGKTFVTESPKASQASGVYNNVTSIEIELYGDGDIYFTTDCSVPTLESEKYSCPIVLEKTGIIRAICVKDNECKSKVANFSYIINENHSLPILSLINDDPQKFNAMYSSCTKGPEYSANLALYENGDEIFNQACGVTLKGWTSVKQPKKSLGVYFRGIYGDGDLEDCDLFGTGISNYSSLSIRSGQDYCFSVVRNELMQELCLEMTNNVPTQHSKYCILYIDGEYYGIYCLKENINEQFYADWANVSKESVVTQKGPVSLNSEIDQILAFAADNDMSDSTNYDYFSSKFDIDNIIDWLILEGYSANTDTQGNIRYFKSSEEDGKYRIAFYDLDWSLENDDAVFYNVLMGYGNSGYRVLKMTESLLRNDVFRDKFLKRYSEVSKTVLSDENVLSKLEELAAIVEPEIERDFTTWDSKSSSWKHRLEAVESFVNRSYSEKTIEVISYCLELSEEEIAYYFE